VDIWARRSERKEAPGDVLSGETVTSQELRGVKMYFRNVFGEIAETFFKAGWPWRHLAETSFIAILTP
jgi:hypothetical protein